MSYPFELENTNLSLKEQVVQILDELSEIELKQVIEYVSFLKFNRSAISPAPDVSQLAKLYADFAEEDRQLAEEGLEDYTASLVKEDNK
jgi:hypothetical protein